jgi:hypothetical protein
MPFPWALSSVRIIVLYPSKWKAHAAIFSDAENYDKVCPACD